jgi:hypothetical protein
MQIGEAAARIRLEQMRELLAPVDAQAADDGGEPEITEELLGRLAMFRVATVSRMESLRAQVQGLGTLSRGLRTLANEDWRWAAMENRRRGTAQHW